MASLPPISNLPPLLYSLNYQTVIMPHPFPQTLHLWLHIKFSFPSHMLPSHSSSHLTFYEPTSVLPLILSHFCTWFAYVCSSCKTKYNINCLGDYKNCLLKQFFNNEVKKLPSTIYKKKKRGTDYKTELQYYKL